MALPFNAIYKNYSDFRENTIQGLQVTSHEIVPLIHTAEEKEVITSRVLGKSFLGEDIHCITIGSGKIKILCWSQMHGNEATATKAIFDILNFIQKETYSKIIAKLISELQITIIPMLNPDGANNFTRVNGQGIDINRDAFATNTPEAKILLGIFNELEPDFCFNLHDQRPMYNVGGTSHPATLSFLAPPFNSLLEVNEVRLSAIKMVVGLERAISKNFPVHIARYSDSYERRAFGDTFQSKGVPTVLFEAGGYFDDFDREFVRKVYFGAMLQAFWMLANSDLENYSEDDYYLIPVNEEKYFDWIIRDVTIVNNDKAWISDIAGRREYNGSKYGKGLIEEIGDLKQFFGYVEIDGSGCTLEPGKIYQDKIPIKQDQVERIINEGYTYEVENDTSDYPLKLNKVTENREWEIKPGQPANLILLKGDKIKRVIMNGFATNESGKMPKGYYGISIY